MKVKTKSLAITLVSLILIFVVATSIIILQTPATLVSSTAGNYSVNLMNKSYLVEDDGFLFLAKPNNQGIIRIDTNLNNEVKQITKNGQNFLQVVGNHYYYLSNNSLYRCKWTGEFEEKILDYAKEALVVGGMIYYKNENNYLCKYSLSTKKVFQIKNEKIGQFTIQNSKIYFLDQNSRISSIRLNGKDEEVFINSKANAFCFSGAYIFFLEDKNLKSAQITADGTLIETILKCDSFSVINEFVIYNQNGNLYWVNINELKDKSNHKAKQLQNFEGAGLSADKNYFYYFNNLGQLYRTDKENKKTEILL